MEATLPKGSGAICEIINHHHRGTSQTFPWCTFVAFDTSCPSWFGVLWAHRGNCAAGYQGAGPSNTSLQPIAAIMLFQTQPAIEVLYNPIAFAGRRFETLAVQEPYRTPQVFNQSGIFQHGRRQTHARAPRA